MLENIRPCPLMCLMAMMCTLPTTRICHQYNVSGPIEQSAVFEGSAGLVRLTLRRNCPFLAQLAQWGQMSADDGLMSSNGPQLGAIVKCVLYTASRAS